ncbi:hypothetical protein [Vibrio sp. B1FIG11]|nr:hypothetical protein [Vibrio sp. B1FIG11]
MKQVQKFEKQQAKTPILPVISTRKNGKTQRSKKRKCGQKAKPF